MTFINLVIIMTLCLVNVTGCTMSDNTTENIEASETQLDTWFDDAMVFEKYEWPSSEHSLSTDIPKPDWSENGEIGYDIDYLFYARIGYSTLDDYNNYVKECQKDDYGFIIEQHEQKDFRYYAENEEGHAIEILYNANNKFIAISVIREPSTWDKWWKTEVE